MATKWSKVSTIVTYKWPKDETHIKAYIWKHQCINTQFLEKIFSLFDLQEVEDWKRPGWVRTLLKDEVCCYLGKVHNDTIMELCILLIVICTLSILLEKLPANKKEFIHHLSFWGQEYLSGWCRCVGLWTAVWCEKVHTSAHLTISGILLRCRYP